MNYCDIIKNSPAGDKSMMWDSVKRISDFLEKIRDEHPAEVRNFLKDEYVALNGRHFTAPLAHNVVSEMHHTGGDGKEISGEAVSVDDAQSIVAGLNDQNAWRWDAYVAANTMAHDLGNTGLNMNQIMEAAKHFFFHDDDFSDENKVFWYYEWMIF